MGFIEHDGETRGTALLTGRMPFDRLESHCRTAKRYIRDYFFSLRYADEAARLVCELSDPEDEVQFRNAERIRKSWYDYTRGRLEGIKRRFDPLLVGMTFAGLARVPVRGPSDLFQALKLHKQGLLGSALRTPAWMRAIRTGGYVLTVFAMGLDGYLLYGNIRDRRYASGPGNVSNIAAGGLTLFEASSGAALLADGGKVAAGWKLATAGTGSVAVPLAVAVGVGMLGAWAIEAAGRKRAHRIVREGVRRVLPGLYDSYFKYRMRADSAWINLKHMASGKA